MSDNGKRGEAVSPLVRAYVAIEDLESRLRDAERSMREPIAIVGMACRYPGGADDGESFWRVLRDGVDAISEVPVDRWDIDAYYDPDPEAPGKMYSRCGGFVRDLDRFDAPFFGIAPREAVSIDPQQRLLLEVAWEALENGGQAPHQLARTKTGVFVGITTHDFSDLCMRSGQSQLIDPYSGTGSAASVASGRLSYVLGLQGPCVAVDTACSSSLVAVHLACQSLRLHECRTALAGGVNAILLPEGMIYFCRIRAMSPEGRCKTFDASADGYIRGEGCGVVVLKRLSDALSDNDTILAVIRGSAINHDGPSGGLTIPSGLAQEAVMRAALANAGVQPAEVSYVEAHGTGTSLGDPIEVQATCGVFGEGRSKSQVFSIGSVKTNIGHLEAAAGIAGLTKVVLALQHQTIPPNLHFTKPNPLIPWERLPVSVPTQPAPWLPGGARNGRRIAGLSAFGFSGTNAHVVVEEAPAREAPPAVVERPVHVLAISAKSETSLRALVERYQKYLAQPLASLADICFTANTGRDHFAWRVAVVARTVDEAREKLRDAPIGRGTAGGRARAAFLFSGERLSRAGMGKELYRAQPAFRKALDRCAELVAPQRTEALTTVLFGEPCPEQREPWFVKVGIFALQYALAELWKSWGIAPAFVMGHGPGEFVAATIAGVTRLEDALKLLAEPAPERFAVMAGAVEYQKPRIAMVSSLTGEIMKEPPAAEYWQRQVHQPTRFEKGIEALQREGCDVCLELGPHPPPVRPAPAGKGRVRPYWPLWEGADEWRVMLDILAGIYSRGFDVDWDGFDRGYARRKVSLPTYPFQRERFWSDALLSGPEGSAHPLLGRCIRSPLKEVLFESTWNAGSQPPAETFHEMALAAAAEAFGPGSRTLLEIAVREPLLVMPGEKRTVQTILTPEADGAASFQVVSASAADRERHLHWTLHAEGRIAAVVSPAAPEGSWLHGVRWERKDSGELGLESRCAHRPGAWAILADGGGVGRALAKSLEQNGEVCVTVCPDARTLDAVLDNREMPLDGVVHLQTLDDESAASCRSVLHLVQAMATRAGNAPRLWVVTRGAHAVDEESSPCAVGPAAVWGLGGVIAVEHPEFCCVRVDLDPREDLDQQAQSLLGEIRSTDGEDQVACRNGSRYVRRLVSLTNDEQQTISGQTAELDPEATYLITGGIGAIGLRVAERLVERGARHLLLSGRRGPSDAAREALSRMQSVGAQVVVVQADVSSEPDVVRLLGYCGASMPRLRGIIHAAGLLDDSILLEQDWQRFSNVMAPKIAGAWNLHLHTLDAPLDFFVLFSSAAAIIGPPGQGNYAAANAFLDALAHHRRARGLAAVSINWGPWSEAGMAASTDGRGKARWRTRGIGGIAPRQGLDLLEKLMQGPDAQVVVLPVNWTEFASQLPAGAEPRLLTHVVRAERGNQLPALLQMLSEAPPNRRWIILRNHVSAQASKVLGLDPSLQIDLRQPLRELGLDSLMAVEMRNALGLLVGANLPVTLLFDHPTIEALVRFLGNEVLLIEASGDVSAPMTGEEETRAQILENVESLSDEEAESVLRSRLEAMR